jgi:hypothetical protein
VVAAVAAAPVGWFGWGRYRGRAVAATILALGGIAFGTWNSQNAILSDGRLRAEMDSISVPPDFVASGDLPGGWSLCFDVCTNYERSWVVTASPEDAEATVTQVLEGQGFVLGPWDTQSSIGSPVVLGHRGRVGVTVMVQTKSVLRNGHDAPLGPGQVGVEVVLDTYF